MKKNILLISILIAAIFPAFAPSLRAADAPLHWAAAYGGSEDDKARAVIPSWSGGYIVAGETASYGAGGTDIYALHLDPWGRVVWMQTYGGLGNDRAYDAQRTSDGGYVIAGSTFSPGSGQSADALVMKIGEDGNLIWTRNYGGSGDERAWSIRQTLDGGFIVAGETNSYGGATECPWGLCPNAWILKLDSAGIEEWSRWYGGQEADVAYAVRQTPDGGYIFAGTTESYGQGGNCDGMPCPDAWVMKLDDWGHTLWSRTYGGNLDDRVSDIEITIDGGYVAAGRTSSFANGKACAGAPCADAWVLKLDENGDQKWSCAYGGPDYDGAASIRQTPDRGYIVAGDTRSYAKGALCGHEFCADAWLLKLDGDGKNLWSACYGGRGDDAAYSAYETDDGSYVIAGYTGSFGQGAVEDRTVSNVWALKVDPDGNCPGCFPASPAPKKLVTDLSTAKAPVCDDDEEPIEPIYLTNHEAAAFVESWRRAWESRDTLTYSSFYDGKVFLGREYQLTGEYKLMRYGTWMEERRRDFYTSRYIGISVRDLKVWRPSYSQQTVLRFNLSYERDDRTEMGEVFMAVERRPEGIRIVEEQFHPKLTPGKIWNRAPGFSLDPANELNHWE